jgi:hypothetical protein
MNMKSAGWYQDGVVVQGRFLLERLVVGGTAGGGGAEEQYCAILASEHGPFEMWMMNSQKHSAFTR